MRDRLGSGLALLAAAGLWGASGCSLILGFDQEVTDAAQTPIDSGPPPAIDGSVLELCNAYEPNNTAPAGAQIGQGAHMARICPGGESDFYSLQVNGSQDLGLTVTFDNMGGSGDLDLQLTAETGAVIEESKDFGNVESIQRTEALGTRLGAGTYRLEVYGFMHSTAIQNNYTLEVVIDPPPELPDAGTADATVGAIDAAAH